MYIGNDWKVVMPMTSIGVSTLGAPCFLLALRYAYTSHDRLAADPDGLCWLCEEGRTP